MNAALVACLRLKLTHWGPTLCQWLSHRRRAVSSWKIYLIFTYEAHAPPANGGKLLKRLFVNCGVGGLPMIRIPHTYYVYRRWEVINGGSGCGSAPFTGKINFSKAIRKHFFLTLDALRRTYPAVIVNRPSIINTGNDSQKKWNGG